MSRVSRIGHTAPNYSRFLMVETRRHNGCVGLALVLTAFLVSSCASAPGATASEMSTEVDALSVATSTTGPSLSRVVPTTVAPRATPVATTSTTTLQPIERRIIDVAPLAVPLSAVGTSSGTDTIRVQQRLLDLGFWVQSTDGEYGVTTRQAVMAAQKYFGLSATASVDDETAAVLSAAADRPVATSIRGTLVEVDKSLQLAFFVVDGVTEWVVNVSTGSEIAYSEPNQNDPSKLEEGDSVTDNGLFHVNREREEGWWDGDLGSIYRPKYFNGGIAVHGSNSIPNYPASHGCVRVSTRAMDWIWANDLMPMGIAVWVHGSNPS